MGIEELAVEIVPKLPKEGLPMKSSKLGVMANEQPVSSTILKESVLSVDKDGRADAKGKPETAPAERKTGTMEGEGNGKLTGRQTSFRDVKVNKVAMLFISNALGDGEQSEGACCRALTNLAKSEAVKESGSALDGQEIKSRVT
jgi:hypothetical protein